MKLKNSVILSCSMNIRRLARRIRRIRLYLNLRILEKNISIFSFDENLKLYKFGDIFTPMALNLVFSLKAKTYISILANLTSFSTSINWSLVGLGWIRSLDISCSASLNHSTSKSSLFWLNAIICKSSCLILGFSAIGVSMSRWRWVRSSLNLRISSGGQMSFS